MVLIQGHKNELLNYRDKIFPKIMEGINILDLEPQDQSNENYSEGPNTPISLCNTPNDPLNLAVKRRLDQLQKTP